MATHPASRQSDRRDRGVPGSDGRAGIGFYGWRLLAVFWVVLFVNLAFPMTGGSLLVTAMARSLGFSREQLGLPFAVYFGVIGIASPVAAALILRLGVRATLALEVRFRAMKSRLP